MNDILKIVFSSGILCHSELKESVFRNKVKINNPILSVSNLDIRQLTEGK